MNINKKAQIGKIITSLPVMLLIFLIIAVYLILSVTIYGAKYIKGDLNIPKLSEGVNLDNVLFNEININGEDITITNALIKLIKNELKREDIDKALENKFNEKGKVLILDIGGTTDHFNAIFLEDGKIIPMSDIPTSYKYHNIYESSGKMKKVSFNAILEEIKKNYLIKYYYGEKLK